MITIVDSGGANLASVVFALQRLGVEAIITHDADVISNASHVILPGVGTAANIMRRLQQLQLSDVICSLKQPLLGICVGMQVLFESSEEGAVPCLDIIPGQVQQLTGKVIRPHMGWNTIDIQQHSPLLNNIPNASYFYFVHSFAAPMVSATCASTTHGTPFSSVVQYHNVFGTQFHPERSGALGRQILKNFLEL